jgi:hypothetical protein
MTIYLNENKYTAAEIKELHEAIWMMNYMGVPFPFNETTVEEWADEFLAKKKAEAEKTAERKAKAKAQNEIPGFKTRKEWKRKGTEIEKMRKEIENLEKKIAKLEKGREELANKYKEETNEEIA